MCSISTGYKANILKPDFKTPKTAIKVHIIKALREFRFYPPPFLPIHTFKLKANIQPSLSKHNLQQKVIFFTRFVIFSA
jgi:hypothetical protein